MFKRSFRFSLCKFFIAHPAGRSGATLLRFSGGHSGSDHVAAGLAKLAPRVARMVPRREAAPLAHLAQPLAYRIPELRAPHSPRPFVKSIQARATAPANSPLPPVRRGWHRGSAIPAAHRAHLRLLQHRATLPTPSFELRDFDRGEPHPARRREFPRRGCAISELPGNPAALPHQTARCSLPHTSKRAARPNHRRSLKEPAAARRAVAPEKFPARRL